MSLCYFNLKKTNMTSYRDVSYGLQKLRDFLLGRKHTLHGRFSPCIAPRTIPPPDLPRGPDIGYANQYYYRRNAFHSVQPPVIAPVAEGPPVIPDPTKKVQIGGIRADAVTFNFAPTPGTPWWWDGHCYFEYVPDSPYGSPSTPRTAPPSNPCPPAPDQKR